MDGTDPMKDKEILQKIVDNSGNCDWSVPEICAKCPMSRLRFRDDGNPLSCVDALNVEGVKIEEADAIYKETAERLLAQMELDQIIEED